MPIIFGWGRQKMARLGFVQRYLCQNCHNEEPWVLYEITTWFTLFFLPIIPYETTYHLGCPIRMNGVNLNDADLKKIRPIAEVNQLLLDGKISPEAHKQRIIELGYKASEPSTVEELPAAINSKNQCEKCGAATVPSMMFCGLCGSLLNHK